MPLVKVRLKSQDVKCGMRLLNCLKGSWFKVKHIIREVGRSGPLEIWYYDESNKSIGFGITDEFITAKIWEVKPCKKKRKRL